MSKFIIQGGVPLKGAVRLGGAKNAGFKLMIASLLAQSESRLLNLAYISDVEITLWTLKQLGVNVQRCGERTVYIQPNGIKTYQVPQLAGQKMRGSALYAAVLLSRMKKAVIPLPGGCVLGSRPIDRHLSALRSLGARVKIKGSSVYLEADKLRGSKFIFSKKSHTATEAMILAAVKARGRTIIENSAQEPEIDDLIVYLNKMGAKIKRVKPEKIIIDGVERLSGAIHQVMPDRNEAVSYAVAALATKGDIVVENAVKKDLLPFLDKLKAIGAGLEVFDFGIRFFYQQELKAIDIQTQPAPGFMTDWQPLWTLLMTQAKGVSRVIERVHNNRFQFAQQLKKMGAEIDFYNPVVKEQERYYEFDHYREEGVFHAARIKGPVQLRGGKLEVTDLRAGATLTIAALVAQGQSTIVNLEHIDRGYEKLDEKLKQLGAKIKRLG